MASHLRTNILLVNLTWTSLMSVPYWFVALQMYFPSILNGHVVVTLVVVANTCDFHISDICIGRVPVAEHRSS